MKTPIVVIIASAIVLSAACVLGQTPVRLTVDDAVARGIEASDRLAELDAKRAVSAAQAAARTAAERPLVSLQAAYVRTNHVTEFAVPGPAGQPQILYPDIPDNFRTRLDLQWPIYTAGRLRSLERAERAETDALEHDRAAARADLKLEITRAYWAVVTAGASVRVLIDALARMDAHLMDARNRLQLGMVPPSDVLSSEAQRSRQQMLLVEARNLRESATADLRRLVGLSPDAAIEVDSTLTAPSESAVSPTALVEQARTGRPERRALEVRLSGADQRTAAADAGRLPSIIVRGGYDYAQPNQRFWPWTSEWKTSWDLGVNLNWSLWDGGRAKADVAQATAGRRALEAELRDFDKGLASEIVQCRLGLESALAMVTSAEDGVRSAAEARRVTSDRYAAGVATNLDVLGAQVALLQAELDRTRALANAQMAAARLNRALGL